MSGRETLYSSSRRNWERQYDEAIQWRDWQTCDLLLEEREHSDWYRRRGHYANLRGWIRLWFTNSYALWREYPSGYRSTRIFATWRGLRAVIAGLRQGKHRV